MSLESKQKYMICDLKAASAPQTDEMVRMLVA